MTHGHMYGVSMDIAGVVDEAASRSCDIVLCGHTHKPAIHRRDGVLAVNPGSLSYPRQNGRRPSYAVLTMQQGGDCVPEIRYL